MGFECNFNVNKNRKKCNRRAKKCIFIGQFYCLFSTYFNCKKDHGYETSSPPSSWKCSLLWVSFCCLTRTTCILRSSSQRLQWPRGSTSARPHLQGSCLESLTSHCLEASHWLHDFKTRIASQNCLKLVSESLTLLSWDTLLLSRNLKWVTIFMVEIAEPLGSGSGWHLDMWAEANPTHLA